MSAKHTPGPLSVGDARRHYAGGWVEIPIHVGQGGTRGNCIAIAYLGGPAGTSGDTDAIEANARLFATAPELLRELELLRSLCLEFWHDAGRQIDMAEWKERLDAAHAAIAKAKGEAQS